MSTASLFILFLSTLSFLNNSASERVPFSLTLLCSLFSLSCLSICTSSSPTYSPQVVIHLFIYCYVMPLPHMTPREVQICSQFTVNSAFDTYECKYPLTLLCPFSTFIYSFIIIYVRMYM